MSKPGSKYDTLAEEISTMADSDACALMIINGRQGSGFSIKHRFDATARPMMLNKLADALEYMAAELRRDAGGTAAH